MDFLRLVKWEDGWLDGVDYPCVRGTQNEVAKELLHTHSDACCCFFFKNNSRIYSYAITRIDVDEPLEGDERWEQFKRQY